QFLLKFHCELNPIEMYWGYAKYRYREIWKTTFANAKTAVIQCLDACPDETIQKCWRNPWHFMDAYRKGLTGKLAAWAVKKQKSHRAICEDAMCHDLAIPTVM
ncbi:uncharacterized protein EI90DRAFT_2943146, partial [Cantharellus anzutake]|uniref:uncharacterized protein n=1 Tax=Cantharellus anzutake TaxID=1750568 RepID=UPI0019050FFC